jgi:hypothetical protein
MESKSVTRTPILYLYVDSRCCQYNPRTCIEMGGWQLWRDGNDQTPPWLVS